MILNDDKSSARTPCHDDAATVLAALTHDADIKARRGSGAYESPQKAEYCWSSSSFPPSTHRVSLEGFLASFLSLELRGWLPVMQAHSVVASDWADMISRQNGRTTHQERINDNNLQPSY